MAPVVVLAAPRTGSGKTIVTAAILRALRRRGLAVAAAKAGPDYIDPGFLAAAAGREAWSLDPWGMRLATLIDSLEQAAAGARLVLVEGVMGLFDGAVDGTGSTGDLASLLDVPVVLVVDTQGLGASVAALVEGFCRFREDVEVAGVILNRVASERHARLLVTALDERLAVPVLGWLPGVAALTLPSRHLGLVQAGEHDDLDARLDRAADVVGDRLDLDRLLKIARVPSITAFCRGGAALPPLGQRIAVAGDAAFGFSYPHVLAGWRDAGAEILPFSPLADAAPDPTADAVYLPGGYPELHGGRLAAAGRLKAGLAAAAARGALIYGECGGYMVLGRTLVDEAGTAHAMGGLLPLTTSLAPPERRLGLRRIELVADGPLGSAGSRFRGHEFHYAREVERGGEPLFTAADALAVPLGAAGCRVGRVMGSFLHLVDRVA